MLPKEICFLRRANFKVYFLVTSAHKNLSKYQNIALLWVGIEIWIYYYMLTKWVKEIFILGSSQLYCTHFESLKNPSSLKLLWKKTCLVLVQSGRTCLIKSMRPTRSDFWILRLTYWCLFKTFCLFFGPKQAGVGDLDKLQRAGII